MRSCITDSFTTNRICMAIAPARHLALLTGSRREASEVAVPARLATEDNAGVFAAILRGVRPSVTKQARSDLTLQQTVGEKCGLVTAFLVFQACNESSSVMESTIANGWCGHRVLQDLNTSFGHQSDEKPPLRGITLSRALLNELVVWLITATSSSRLRYLLVRSGIRGS